MMFRILLPIAWVITASIASAANCPFCTAVSQTFRQEMAQTDVVVLASFLSAQSDSVATFEVKRVFKGGELAAVGSTFSAKFFGEAKADQSFIVMGVGPNEILWSAPLKANDKVQAYFDELLKLPTDNSKVRLKFFISQLSNSDPTIARDVFDEFASASYAEMIELKDQYDREQLLKWIQDVTISPDRRKLYMVMLGICGKAEDADILEQLMKSDDVNRQAGLDALIACYLTLKGEKGLPLIEERYLAKENIPYLEIYSAITAIRFHGSDARVIDRKRLAKSFHIILDRPKFADLVIPDLARWEDWTQMDKIVELFMDAEKNETQFVKEQVIKYLRVCPLPEAAKHLAVLKEMDPATYRRGVLFFPLPSDGTQLPAKTDFGSVASVSQDSKIEGKASSVTSVRCSFNLQHAQHSDPIPFVEISGSTLSQEASLCDMVVTARLLSNGPNDLGTLEIQKVLKGSEKVKVGEKTQTPVFNSQPGKTFLLFGIVVPDEDRRDQSDEILWDKRSHNDKIEAYVESLMKLPTDDSKARLKFFVSQLNETDRTISIDVYEEIASSSYKDLIELKDQYNREQLLKWIQDVTTSPDRLKLFLVMLGICGKAEDADILEKLIKSDETKREAGLNALIACYLTLKGEKGLPLIEEKYLAKENTRYLESYSAISAIRFLGDKLEGIDRKRLAKSLHIVLDRPKIADLAIPYLARWEDWTQMDKIVELFINAEKNETLFIREHVIIYLRVCPLPEAAKHLERLKEMDPACYRRVAQIFPLPCDGANLPSSNDFSDISRNSNNNWAGGTTLAAAVPAALPINEQPVGVVDPVNLVSLASVVGTFAATLWIGMWLTITGAGRQPAWLLALVRR